VTTTLPPEAGLAAPAADAGIQAPAVATAPRRRRFGIQPRLLLMLLATSVASALIAGYVGYHAGTESLRDSAFDRLTEVRESKAREIEQLFRTLQNSMVVYTQDLTAIEAVQAFSTALDRLQTVELTPAQDEALRRYYFDDVVVPALEARGRFAPQDPIELPDSPAARYLQAEYSAPWPTAQEAILVDDAGDGSTWSAAHARFHDYFRDLAQRVGYNDVLLIDDAGDVVYSAYKRIDLGTNVLDGPFAGTALARVYEAALESNSRDFFTVTDFERYQPTLGLPQAFAASPIAVDGETIGALAVELPVEAINTIMTFDQVWETQGMGETGETYLAGPDFLMRSHSRLVLEDPDEYYRRALAGGLEEDAAAFAARVRGSIFFQRVETEAVDRALRGETGTVVADEYLGEEALVAFAPLDAAGLPWVIIAKLDTGEAFEPTRQFAIRLGVATGIIVLVVCVASWLLAQVFARPVRRLVNGVRAVAAGDFAARVDARSNDEFGDLGSAFNDMARSLQTKQELLDRQHEENERLLRSLMPDRVARRYREGAETVVEDHADVAVVFAEVTGLEEHTRGTSPRHGLSLLNEIVRGFDDAAERVGVERVISAGSSYCAASGLTEHRDDPVHRAAEFAQTMTQIVRDVDERNGAGLGVRIGIGHGAATSGLVGRSNVAFEVWGPAVDDARRAAAVVEEPGIYVSAAVHDALDGVGSFEPIGDDVNRGTKTAWRWLPERGAAAP
jgi:class 3 adenylate cyclase